jgi:hypothetical protein
MVAPDGGAILCMRGEGGKPKTLKDGSTGWIHRLGGKPVRLPQKPPRTKPRFNAAILRGWMDITTPKMTREYAESLGVSQPSVVLLGACYTGNDTWAWPMRDSSGKIIGVRLRSNNGRKWAVAGSSNGLFMTQRCPSKVYVCEGPTDTAAAISIGLFAVGRPSCSGGGPAIVELVKKRGVKEVVIIADTDRKKRPDGSPWNPGLEGAQALKERLPVKSSIITLPCKDLREFVRNGGAASDLIRIERNG